MTVLLTNNVSTTLSAAIAAGDATFTVVDGNRFPSPTTGEYAYATLVAPNGAVEIVKVTSRIGNALGVARAQEGTTAQVFPAGSRVELRVTAATVTDAALDTVQGGAAQMLGLVDGVTAPTTVSGKAFIYVDTTGGDLKIKFGDGTIKTIVVDT